MESLLTQTNTRETAQKTVALRFFLALIKQGRRIIELSVLHQVFGLVKRNLDGPIPVNRLDQMPALRRIRFNFQGPGDDGLFPDLSRITDDLRTQNPRALELVEHKGINYIVFLPLADRLWSEQLKQLSKLSPEEEADLSKLVLFAATTPFR